jgi:protocatechuate 3,4-dioxygenase beta subunit
MHVRGPALTVIVAVMPVLSGLVEASQSATAAGSGVPPAQITLSGRVTDSQGKPVQDAEVTLYQMRIGELKVLPRIEVIDRKTTGADGAFTFAVAKGGETYREGRVIARKGGFSLGWAVWQMRVDQRLDIPLGQPTELAGDVVDEAGRPIADAEVNTAMAMMGRGEDLRDLPGPGFLRTRTDRNGRFLFANMPAEATFEFLVEAPGRATISTFNMTSYSRDQCQFSPGQAGIKLTLSAEARIEGVVVEKAGGKPVGGVQVAAQAGWWQDTTLPSKLAVTAEDGTFRIGGLSADRCTLKLPEAPGQVAEWVANKLRLSVKAGETTSGIRMQITKGAILGVLVRDPAGKSVGNVQVYLCPTHPGQSFGGETDESGLARIRVVPGSYSVAQLSRRGYIRWKSTEQVTVGEGETKRIECTVSPMPMVTGIVRDEAGNPLSGVTVQATWSRPSSSSTVQERSDASGMFDITGDPYPMEQGATVVFAARDPAHNLARALEIDERTGPLDLKLEPGVIITGTVLNQEGKPLPGASVLVILRGSKATVPVVWGEPTVGPDGVFEIKAIPPERECAVTVSADNYAKRTISIGSLDPKESCHDIGQVRLTRGELSVSGTVVDPNGNPVAYADVSTFGEGQPDLRGRADAQGKFIIKGVCPGPISLHAYSPGAWIMYGDTQAGGGATDVRITTSERVRPVGLD